MKKFGHFLLLFCCLHLTAIGQTKVEQYRKQLKTATLTEEQRLNIYCEIIRLVNTFPRSEYLNIFEEVKSEKKYFSRLSNQYEFVYKIYERRSFAAKGERDKATNMSDSLAKVNVSVFPYEIRRMHYGERFRHLAGKLRHKEAIEMALKALYEAEKEKDVNDIIGSMSSLGQSYLNYKDYVNAKKWLYAAYEYGGIRSYSEIKGDRLVYYKLGSYHNSNDEYKIGEVFLLHQIPHSIRKNDYKSIEQVYLLLAMAAYDNNDTRTGRLYADKMMEVVKTKLNGEATNEHNYNLLRYTMLMGDKKYKEAETFWLKNIEDAKKNNSPDLSLKYNILNKYYKRVLAANNELRVAKSADSNYKVVSPSLMPTTASLPSAYSTKDSGAMVIIDRSPLLLTATGLPKADSAAAGKPIDSLSLRQKLAEFKKLVASFDSIDKYKEKQFSKNNAGLIAKYETEYKVKAKELKIAMQKSQLWLSILLFSILLSAAGLFIFNYKRTQKAKIVALQEQKAREKEAAIQNTRENERNRISRELHDNIGAQLSYIRSNINFLKDSSTNLQSEVKNELLNKIELTTHSAITDLRETIWVLHKDFVHFEELADKLKSQITQRLQDYPDLHFVTNKNIQADWQLNATGALNILRIIQEAVSNIIKYAHAKEIVLTINSQEQNYFEIKIKDNGVGFDLSVSKPGHYGLSNMRERAKEFLYDFSISSFLNQGTEIILTQQPLPKFTTT